MAQKFKLAILDMNKAHPNQGMRCIREVVSKFEEEIEYDEFEVRVSNELPGTDYDIYISSGGPGSPYDGNGIWEPKFFQLLDDLWAYNQQSKQGKKFFFFICHSFQLACMHFQLGAVVPRKSTSFGIYPVHKTPDGQQDRLLDGLPDPYYVVDSRDWQLIQPNLDIFAERGASILSLEKIRNHVELERAIMAVRFSEEFVGTQFHPEVDQAGMLFHFQKAENKEKVIRNFGEAKYTQMMEFLMDPDKVERTHQTLLPEFIKRAIHHLKNSYSAFSAS